MMTIDEMRWIKSELILQGNIDTDVEWNKYIEKVKQNRPLDEVVEEFWEQMSDMLHKINQEYANLCVFARFYIMHSRRVTDTK